MLSANDQENIQIAPADLVMDTSNPRLKDLGIGVSEAMSEKELIKRLVLTSDIQELLLSIATNGYVPFEPLIIIGDSAPFRVLEGNRRLAAIRLILNSALAKELNVNVPPISDDVLKTLGSISAVKVKNEQDAWPYIGFKHVNGPHKWSSLSKARFAAHWLRSSNITIDQISNHLGDKNATIRKMLEGIFVLEQAEEHFLFSIENRMPERPFAFSHLYTALTRKEYRDFLNLGPTSTASDPAPNPVPAEKMHELRTMLRWMYGDKTEGISSVIASQNPDLGRLGKVLASSIALAVLEQQKSLGAAFDETVPKEQAFKDNLVAAYSSGREAMGLAYSYKGSDEQLEEIANELVRIATTISETMERISKKATQKTTEQ